MRKGERVGKEIWLLYSIVFMLFWTPVLFIYYPGIVPEDATVSIAMVLGDLPWDNHFPVFYSLLAGGSVWLGRALGNPNLGVLLYSLLQLVSMAFLLGYFFESGCRGEFIGFVHILRWPFSVLFRYSEIMPLLCGRIHGIVGFCFFLVCFYMIKQFSIEKPF